jgi:predicted DCC family thiol-disulfide oxidoreductase YuxK
MLTFHLSWTASLKTAGEDTIFYDGHCGLCHRTVRFLLAKDHTGERFRFAPLESNAFAAAVPEAQRHALPDSLIVLTSAGSLLTRSTAVIYLLRRLGGLWRVLGEVLVCIPITLRDIGYDSIARIRYRLFSTPAQACPLVPAELRGRFRS